MNRRWPAAGGEKVIEVTTARLDGWFERFAERHDDIRRVEPDTGSDDAAAEARGVASFVVQARDGATATAEVPFPPLPAGPVGQTLAELRAALPARPLLAVDAVCAHLTRPRRVGLVLVRLGGHGVAIAESGRILVSATDHRPVHGRNKAGGWSRQRFARRHAGQARIAPRSAARDIPRVLGGRLAELDAVVLGGDRRARTSCAPSPRWPASSRWPCRGCSTCRGPAGSCSTRRRYARSVWRSWFVRRHRTSRPDRPGLNRRVLRRRAGASRRHSERSRSPVSALGDIRRRTSRTMVPWWFSPNE